MERPTDPPRAGAHLPQLRLEAARPAPITFDTPDSLEAAVAVVSAHLARGEPAAQLEDRVLATRNVSTTLRHPVREFSVDHLRSSSC